MNRRAILGAGAALALAGLARPLAAQGNGGLAQRADPLWAAWKSAFLRPEGRVVDTLQDDASHSEGQGYAMVLATEFDDPDAFARMFEWTERNLAIRPDALLAWRWLPDRINPVPDRNNASDGDLFYAWALVRAANRFGNRAYMDRARAIAADLVARCVVARPGASEQTVLLPAAHGFAQDGRVSVNPSYYMPLAMRELAAATGASALAICAQQGEALIDTLAADGLVPDWVDITADGMTPADRLSPNTGYEALRVPLFLIWSRNPGHVAVRRMAALYARTVTPGQPVPTVVEPLSGVVLESSPDPGYQALAGLVACADVPMLGTTMPPFVAEQPYYPATLHLFAMIAAHATLPECVPL